MQKRDPSQSFSKFGDGIRFLVAALHYHGGLALLGLALMAPLAGFGRGLGAPYLYWHDSPRDQAIVGLVMGLVYWHLGFITYVLVANKPGVLRGSDKGPAEAGRYVNRAIGPLLLMMVAAAMALSCCMNIFAPDKTPPTLGMPLLLGLCSSYLFVLLTLRATQAYQGSLGRIAKLAFDIARLTSKSVASISSWMMGFELKDHLAALEKDYEQRWHVFGMMVFFSVLTVIGYFVLSLIALVGLGWFGRNIPAAVPYCMALAVIASAYCFLRTLARRLVWPALVVVVLFGGCQWLRYPGNMQMPSNCETTDCEEAWAQSRSLRDMRPAVPATELVDDDEALRNLVTRTQFNEPIVIITTSGGGIRSAGWTVAVFAQLEAMDPEFFDRVRLITGASGGMVGASHWVAERMVADIDVGTVYCHATASSLYAPLGTMILSTPGRNRGEALELAWEHAAPELGKPLHALAERERAGTLPSLVFAPMLIEDGSQMLMSNLDLAWYAHADRWDFNANTCAIGQFLVSEGGCGNARQFFARVPSERVKISTLARVSASFPYLSPAVTLPFDEHPRAVDAGYYDNYGIKLATEWITRHTYRCPQGGECLKTQPILLLELRDHNPDGPIEYEQTRPLLHELISPIQGLFGARLHVANHRNAAVIGELRAELGDRFEHAVLNFEGEAALGWELTQQERSEIWAKADAELSTADELMRWWRMFKIAVGGVVPTQPRCE